MNDHPDNRLKVADPDRWLGTRFIGDPVARRDVVALYALDLELGAVAQRATNPLMAEIRFAWWRERCEALVTGAAGTEHPVLTALAPALAQGRMALTALDAMISARHAELSDPWFEDESALDLYLEDLDVTRIASVAARLDPSAPHEAFAAAARLDGLARLAHRVVETGALPAWWPRTWQNLAAEAGCDDAVLRHLGHKLDQLRLAARSAPALSPEAFPAIAHVALATDQRQGPIRRRLRLLQAVAAGRI